MSAQPDLSKLSLTQFAERFRGEMIPLSNQFSYFCASVPMSEEELKEYLEEPVAALPPSIAAALPKIAIFLVPYLEKSDSAEPSEFIAVERPPDNRSSLNSQVRLGNETVLAFALKGQEVAEYHYRFYNRLATLIGENWTEEVESAYSGLIREELNGEVHGEVDEASWRLKQSIRRGKAGRKDSKAFREYARQSFIDTLTLYLHGICCDIDVETGPRQLASRYLRRRLQVIRGFYPPPKGYAVFPEELKNAERPN